MQQELQLAKLVSGLDNLRSTKQLELVYCKTADMGHDGGPYKWQVEFHNAGAFNPERAIIAANQTGKTRSAAAEVAIHATGQYPRWWKGRRFMSNTEWLVAGMTNELTRDVCQFALLGSMQEGKITGTGWIPADCIGEYGFRNCGVKNVIDYVKVKNRTGRWSVIYLKSFEQGYEKFQGSRWHGAWLDEEPGVKDEKVYSECQRGLIAHKGLMLFTRTPMRGRTPLILHYIHGGPGIYYVNATWDDAPHLDEEAKARQLSSWPKHERPARTKGIPMMGSGGVYNVSDEEIACDPFEIPTYFRRICGIDFGIDHPAAGVWLAHDADADTVYIYDCYRTSGQTSVYHAGAINSRGKWIPVAWPHDGMDRDKGSGVVLKRQYENHEVRMLPFSARYNDLKGGGQGTEPVVTDILERMRTGRFKVFRHLSVWFEEKGMYHREDGVIVKIHDDILSATHYAMMMLRFATTRSDNYDRPASVMEYDPLGDFV